MIILVVSGIILMIGFILFFLGINAGINAGWEALPAFGFFMMVIAVIGGFGVFGFLFPYTTEITIADKGYIEKNETSLVIIAPNVDSKVITDLAVVAFVEVGDTVKIKREYNSYGIELDINMRIYVEKNGWKY
jgi:hypothetical protein